MNKYKYNGKEWQDDFGLNMYAMDMRQYDPAIARWVVQDPIVHHSQSPYNGYDGNPVFWADPSGGKTRTSDYNWSTGEYASGSWQNAVAKYNGGSAQEDEESDYFASPEAESVKGEGHEAGLTVGGWNQEEPKKVIDNNNDATVRYYYGDGSPAELGPETKRALRNSTEYQFVLNRLLNGTAIHRTNTFDVDLTWNGAFQVGNTNVDYSTSCSKGNCTTTFRAFVRDGFRDPLSLGWEVPVQNDLGETLIPKPYDYLPYVFSISYINPGYPVGNNIR